MQWDVTFVCSKHRNLTKYWYRICKIWWQKVLCLLKKTRKQCIQSKEPQRFDCYIWSLLFSDNPNFFANIFVVCIITNYAQGLFTNLTDKRDVSCCLFVLSFLHYLKPYRQWCWHWFKSSCFCSTVLMFTHKREVGRIALTIIIYNKE